MAKSIHKTVACLVYATLIVGCGDSESEVQEATVYAKATFANSFSEAENGDIELTKVDACTVDSTTGLANFSFSSGRLRKVVMAIKGFSSVPRSYTCTQAADNATSSGSVGNKYDVCMVETARVSSTDTTTANGYSMHRVSTDIKLFNYAGACSITLTTATGDAQGTFSCAGMVQSVLDGSARNPISEEDTTDVTGEFKCKIAN